MVLLLFSCLEGIRKKRNFRVLELRNGIGLEPPGSVWEDIGMSCDSQLFELPLYRKGSGFFGNI